MNEINNKEMLENINTYIEHLVNVIKTEKGNDEVKRELNNYLIKLEHGNSINVPINFSSILSENISKYFFYYVKNIADNINKES